ncbi:DUF177 domain-containing protein [Thermodesulfobacteriota bacterium]
MFIRFDEIPDDGLQLEIDDESWFPHQDIHRSGLLKVSVSLEKRENRIFVSGSMDVRITLECDRCLDFYDFVPEKNFRLVLELDGRFNHSGGAAEHSLNHEDMDVALLDKPVIDLFDILSQQVSLMMPQKHLCLDDCKGLCGQCGMNLNKEQCECGSGGSSTPFDILDSLTK